MDSNVNGVESGLHRNWRPAGESRSPFSELSDIWVKLVSPLASQGVTRHLRSFQAGLFAFLIMCQSTACPQATNDQYVESSLQRGAQPQAICLQRFSHQQAGIKVDGVLNEVAWQVSPVNQELRVISPDTLAATPYRTAVRIFYTERGLYFSFDLEQPPDTIVARDTARDNVSENRDHVSFSLDTSGTGLYGYWMNLALGDNVADGTLMPERQYNREWDGAWYGATQRTDSGWTAEAFVPWSQLSMPKESYARLMGVYVSRKVAHLNESWAWPALPKTQPQFMSILPKIAFISVDPRQEWSLFPYVSTNLDRVDNETRYKAGMDMFWRPSSNFQLTATVNPDFGAVESDDLVVNFSADETFFPEKRLFFLEGQDIFNTTARSVSTNGQGFTVVNTRRIGGRPDPPPGLDYSFERHYGQPTCLVQARQLARSAKFAMDFLLQLKTKPRSTQPAGQSFRMVENSVSIGLLMKTTTAPIIVVSD